MRVRDASTDSAWPWGEQFVHTSKSYVCACVSKRELLSLSSTCTDSDSSDTRQISGKLQGVAPVWELTCFLLRGEPQGVATVTDAQGGVIHLHFRHGPEKGEKHTSGICIEALERF